MPRCGSGVELQVCVMQDQPHWTVARQMSVQHSQRLSGISNDEFPLRGINMKILAYMQTDIGSYSIVKNICIVIEKCSWLK